MVDLIAHHHEPIKILQLDDLAGELRLHDFAVDHGHVDEQEQIHKRTVLHIEVGDDLESNALLLFLAVGALLFLGLLETDVVPLQHHIVAVVHEGVVVLDVDLHVADVLDTDDVPLGEVLDQEVVCYFGLGLGLVHGLLRDGHALLQFFHHFLVELPELLLDDLYLPHRTPLVELVHLGSPDLHPLLAVVAVRVEGNLDVDDALLQEELQQFLDGVLQHLVLPIGGVFLVHHHMVLGEQHFPVVYLE